MASEFILQIVHEPTGEIVVEWIPRDDAKEMIEDLLNRLEAMGTFQLPIDDILASIEAKGVGLFRTTPHVLQDVRDVLQEYRQAAFGQQALRDAWREMLQSLKDQV